MTDKNRKTCQSCGNLYVPESNNQKYCPDCRSAMAQDGTVKEAFLKYQKARQPGEVVTFKLDQEPEKKPEKKPEAPPLPEGWMEEQKKLQLPDWDAFVMQAMEILIRYGRGELVDKSELLEEIREWLG